MLCLDPSNGCVVANAMFALFLSWPTSSCHGARSPRELPKHTNASSKAEFNCHWRTVVRGFAFAWSTCQYLRQHNCSHNVSRYTKDLPTAAVFIIEYYESSFCFRMTGHRSQQSKDLKLWSVFSDMNDRIGKSLTSTDFCEWVERVPMSRAVRTFSLYCISSQLFLVSSSVISKRTQINFFALWSSQNTNQLYLPLVFSMNMPTCRSTLLPTTQEFLL